MKVPLFALALLCSGCGSYQTDLENMCHVSERMGTQPVDPARRAVQQATWLSDRLGSKEGKRLFESLAPAEPSQRALLLQREAASHGITACPLATEWAQQAAMTAEHAAVDDASTRALQVAAQLRALAAASDAGP